MTVETVCQEDKDWGKVWLSERESAGASCYSIRQKLWLLHAAVLILTANEAALAQALWLGAFSEQQRLGPPWRSKMQVMLAFNITSMLAFFRAALCQALKHSDYPPVCHVKGITLASGSQSL